MFRSYFTHNLQEKYYAVRNTVLADFIFTTPAVFVQPITGGYLLWRLGIPWNTPWLLWCYGLYILVGCFWLPVVCIQIKLRNILFDCLQHNKPLPPSYQRLFILWWSLGIPTFFCLIGIFYLMVVKPV